VVAPLGPPHVRLLLGPARRQHPVRAGEVGQHPLGDLVLALAFPEVHQLQPAGGDEVADVRDERLAHRIHQRGGGIHVAAVAGEEPRHPAAIGQPGLPDVQVHPVDALSLEGHVIRKDIGQGARYRHGKLRSGTGCKATYRHQAVIDATQRVSVQL
jgi:hypothetical protein